MQQMTYAIARAASMDAANAQMRAAHRTTWNRADYNLACRMLNRLYPEPLFAG